MGTRNRDIVFLCLALAFLATAIVLVRRGSTPPAPAVTVPRPAHKAAPAVPEAAANAQDPRKTGTSLAKPARNPFATPAGVAAQPAEATKKPAAPAAATAVPAPTPTPAPAPEAVVPTLPTPSLPPLASPAPVEKATGPVLTGVIGGTTRYPTAIIRNGNQRYFAKQGDKIAGRYTVQSVSNQQVVLVSAQGKLTLKMGGS